MHRHQISTELLCLACNKSTIHTFDYLDEDIKMITCSTCGLSYELIIEINLSHYPKQLLHRLLTKPGRVLNETRSDLAGFAHTFPLRVVTKPYRLLSELVSEGPILEAGGKSVDTDIFCCVCNEPTRHKLFYYKDVMHYSRCTDCGLKMEFVSLVIKISNYPEEIAYRIITKSDRLLKEIGKQDSKLIYAIPVRIITKPYRACREVLDRILDSMERKNG